MTRGQQRGNDVREADTVRGPDLGVAQAIPLFSRLAIGNGRRSDSARREGGWFLDWNISSIRDARVCLAPC